MQKHFYGASSGACPQYPPRRPRRARGTCCVPPGVRGSLAGVAPAARCRTAKRSLDLPRRRRAGEAALGVQGADLGKGGFGRLRGTRRGAQAAEARRAGARAQRPPYAQRCGALRSGGVCVATSRGSISGLVGRQSQLWALSWNKFGPIFESRKTPTELGVFRPFTVTDRL
jgi:hypothetical protein